MRKSILILFALLIISVSAGKGFRPQNQPSASKKAKAMHYAKKAVNSYEEYSPKHLSLQQVKDHVIYGPILNQACSQFLTQASASNQIPVSNYHISELNQLYAYLPSHNEFHYKFDTVMTNPEGKTVHAVLQVVGHAKSGPYKLAAYNII